jgi:hypothetical protein
MRRVAGVKKPNLTTGEHFGALEAYGARVHGQSCFQQGVDMEAPESRASALSGPQVRSDPLGSCTTIRRVIAHRAGQSARLGGKCRLVVPCSSRLT